jgi:hypothetical protein
MTNSPLTEGRNKTVPVDEDIVASLLANFDCQPVLFVGAGLSRRYLDAPDWQGSLRNALDFAQFEASKFDYFTQKHEGDLVKVGTEISDLVFEWAWRDQSRFDESFYKSEDKSIFLKKVISDQLSQLDQSNLSKQLKKELSSFSKIRPHAIITTNYDLLLESVFEGYEAIVGKGVLRYNLNSYGEIFHIHGIQTSPQSMVLVEKDYDQWHVESQYFAAKLLTYFVEHPIFIFGYGLGDPNIRTVLSDIGRIVADDDGLISNVVQVVWDENAEEPSQSEYAINGNGGHYRIRVLQVNDLGRVFELLSGRHELKDVNPAMVRALAARVMKLTRRDIPNGEIEIDFSTLERISNDDNELPKMLGLTMIGDVNKTHPFPLSLAAEKMGLASFNHLVKVINKIKDETGISLRETDNKYHCSVKTGKTSVSHKWSHAAIDLFSKVLSGEKYELEM